MTPIEKIKICYKAVLDGFLKITVNENDFLMNIEKTIKEGKEITWKQSKWLNAIWERIE